MSTITVPADRAVVFAGIDWGGSFHQLCLVDGHGTLLLQQRFDHTVEGLIGLTAALSAHNSPVLVAIERADGLLIERLLTLDIDVFCVSPKISARARERYRLAAKKSDRFDAYVLADTLRHEHDHWHPLIRPSDLLLELRAVIGDRERVVWRQRDLENQLRAVMESYNPAVLHLFSSLDRDIALDFIRTYPDPAQVARITETRMADYLTRHHYSGRTPAEVLLARLEPHLLAAGDGTNRARAFAATRFADELKLLNRQIHEFDHQLDRLLTAHPDTAYFTGFPGIGPVVAGTLLAVMGEDRARFPAPEALLAETGLAPVTRSSGRSHHVGFRYAANKRMRHAIDDWMLTATRVDPEWTGQLYTAARAAGQGHHRALRGIGARWTRILWRCWTDHACYALDLHPHRRDALKTTAATQIAA